MVSTSARTEADSHPQRFLSWVSAAQLPPPEAYPLSRLRPAAFALFAGAAAVYLTHVLVAIANQRYLFGDNAWFLLKLLSERHTANWSANWPHDFYVSRIGTFAALQFPALLVAQIAPDRFPLVSTVFGATAFLHKPLALLVCYAVVRDKRWVIFPAASLFAASINSEVFIVSEAHFLHSLFWALVFLLLFSERLTGWRLLVVLLLSIPTLLSYETMVVFGPLLAVAAFRAGLGSSSSRAQMWIRSTLAAWFLLGAVFAAISIAHPRDPVNRGAVVGWLLSFAAHPTIHIGAAASAAVVLVCVGIVLASERRPDLARVLVIVGVVASLALLPPILVAPARTDFAPHAGARALHLPLPALLALVVLLAFRGRIRIGPRAFNGLFVVVSTLGIAQSTWQLLATSQWSNMITLLKQELRTRSGPIPYEQSVMSRAVVGGQPIAALHGRWPLLPLSVVIAENRVVRSMIVFRDGTFHPFDPDRESEFPRLERHGFDARPYFDQLRASRAYWPGGVIDFTDRGNSGRYRTGSWWTPEPWATWTGGPESGLRLELAGWNGKNLQLEATLASFVNERNPSVTVQVLANGCAVATWEFAAARRDHRVQQRRAILPAPCLARRPEVAIDFRIRGAMSPESANQGPDPRALAVAFVDARLVPFPAGTAR
jgi:hypothetical protein